MTTETNGSSRRAKAGRSYSGVEGTPGERAGGVRSPELARPRLRCRCQVAWLCHVTVCNDRSTPSGFAKGSYELRRGRVREWTAEHLRPPVRLDVVVPARDGRDE